MKSEVHPKDYREVVFKDTACDFSFLTRSCARTNQTTVWTDGKEYPVVLLGISSASHPFFTGQKMFVDTAGRVEKFSRRFANAKTTIASAKAKAMGKPDPTEVKGKKKK